MKNKKKIISLVELKRREMQRQGSLLYTPEGMIVATKVKGGYKLSQRKTT